MKIKTYLFRLFVAVAAFIFGVGFYNSGLYLQSLFPSTGETATSFCPLFEQEIAVVPIVENLPVTGQNDSASDSHGDGRYDFDATGDYYIFDSESKPAALPKAFSDFEEISITTRDYANASAENDYAGDAIPPRGYVQAKKAYNFVRINVADRKIAFQTETKKGISYKFVGNFIDNSNNSATDEYYDLEGHLTKMRNGKKIAETKLKLIAGGC